MYNCYAVQRLTLIMWRAGNGVATCVFTSFTFWVFLSVMGCSIQEGFSCSPPLPFLFLGI